MNLTVRPFQELSVSDRADFYVHAQDLLVTYHPESPFIFRRDNVTERMKKVKEMSNRYQGLVYSDDNIAVLFNRIVVSDPKDAIGAIKSGMFQPPHPDYNAVSIDFVVFRDIKDCMAFCQSQYDPKIAHLVYVKDGKPRIYKTEDIIAKAMHVPKAFNA